MKNPFRNLLIIFNLAIVAGFICGFAKSIINISTNKYIDYKMYNLILFDLASTITKFLIFFLIGSIIMLILVKLSKWIARILNLSALGVHRNPIALSLGILIILFLILGSYAYYSDIVIFLKSSSLTTWLGSLSKSPENTHYIFSITIFLILLFFVSTISYSIWHKSIEKFFDSLENKINTKSIKILGLTLVSIVILFNLAVFGYKNFNTPEGPNVVLITIDTLRADHLGSYGYKRNTSPNIDKLANDGVLFENAVSQAPWTFPSMASMYTSLYPSEVRAKHITSSINNKFLTLSEYMKNNFYNTIAVVSHIVVSKMYGFSQGFDTFNQKHIAEVDEISSEIITQQAVEYISKNKDEKFFLWVHYFDPHQNYRNHTEYDYSDGYDGPLPANLENEKLNKMNSSLKERDIEYVKSIYDEEIAYTDKHIGRLLDSIDKFGLGNDTIIVLTSDHGEEFMERGRIGHGTSLHRELTHVPLIIYNPLNNSMSGKRVSKHVEIRNIAKTILELSNMNENIFQGVNLLDHEKLNLDHIVISENYGFQEGPRSEAIIYQNWKLINNTRNQADELYKIDSDNNEINNLFTMKKEEVNIQKEKLQSIISMINNNNEEDSEELELSKEEIKQLKALGYIQ
ncbi:MAG: hypothetical protein DHS20C13_07990 [Thermodesulfobacteriota bacterium]|nr:MAG: hypothetical protein DHS20C13_07990 [Thermodesulfobacteriota bacterium]